MTNRITTQCSAIVWRRPFFPPLLLSCLLSVSLLSSGPALAAERAVFDSASLYQALRNANAGDNIVLYPGQYKRMETESIQGLQHYYYSDRSGTKNDPITVRSYSRNDMQEISGRTTRVPGYVLHLTGDYWVVKDLIVHTGLKGIMLDSANHNVLDNIEVSNISHEGIHFRNSSSNNRLSNCHIFDTGRTNPKIGEAVYVGSHEGNQKRDYSHSNRIGGCKFGPGITAESVDIKEATIGTIVEYNTMDASGLSGTKNEDSFIDIKGDEVIIRHNRMDWQENIYMERGIHILRQDHRTSNIYDNTATIGSDIPFLYVQQGTVQAQGNKLNITTKLAHTHGSGAVSNTLSKNMAATYSYTGFQKQIQNRPEPEPEACQRIEKGKKTEIDISTLDCIDMTVELSGKLVQVWDSNQNTSCNFRGEIISTNTTTRWAINSNYAGTRALIGQRLQITPSNGCNYLIVRWL